MTPDLASVQILKSLQLTICVHFTVPGAPFPPLCCHHRLAFSHPETTLDSSPLAEWQASSVLPPRSLSLLVTYLAPLTHHYFHDTPDSAPACPAPDGHVWPHCSPGCSGNSPGCLHSRPCLCSRAQLLVSLPSLNVRAQLSGFLCPGAPLPNTTTL